MSVKIGFIGVGGIAGAHLNNLNNFDDIEFVAMCDVVEDKARGRSEEFGGTPYTDFREMFDKEELDAIYICTPPFAHGEQERIACDLKIPMFIEKPVAVTLEQGIIINDMIERSGVITSVGYHWRYQASTVKSLDVLEDKKVLGALGYWMGGMPGTPWWRVRAKSGGQHVEQTTHIFDLCRYLVGSDAKTVHGVAESGTMTDVPNYDVDDISMVNIEFENGAVANIASSCAMQGWGKVQLEVFSRGLVVRVGGGFEINCKGETDSSTEGYEGQNRDRVFIDAVKTGDASEIKSPYSDAFKTCALTMAASKSFETGRVVDL